jgi:2'-5' RNA ligase
LFLKVAEGPGLHQLHTLANVLVEAFQGSGLVADDKPFDPHVTIAKTSRMIGKRGRGEASGGI